MMRREMNEAIAKADECSQSYWDAKKELADKRGHRNERHPN